MAMDFPDSPVVGQTYIVDGTTWTWDGVKWDKASTTIVGAQGVQGLRGHQGIQGIQGTQGLQGVTGAGLLTYGPTPPISPNVGDRWVNSNSGIEYTWIQDGSSGQWVDTRPAGYLGLQGIQGTYGIQGLQGLQGPSINPDSDQVIISTQVFG